MDIHDLLKFTNMVIQKLQIMHAEKSDLGEQVNSIELVNYYQHQKHYMKIPSEWLAFQ